MTKKAPALPPHVTAHPHGTCGWLIKVNGQGFISLHPAKRIAIRRALWKFTLENSTTFWSI